MYSKKRKKVFVPVVKAKIPVPSNEPFSIAVFAGDEIVAFNDLPCINLSECRSC